MKVTDASVPSDGDEAASGHGGGSDEPGLFDGPGEVRRLCRAFDWSSTPLGPVRGWPTALTVSVQIVQSIGLPSVVLWGRELVQIYNDAYAELIQGKHPRALGGRNLEVWPEVAEINRPIYDRVFEGETVTSENARYPLERSGDVEDVYLTISYSPIRSEVGAIGGVLVTMLETTRNVTLEALQEEREHLYRELDLERRRLAAVFHEAPAFIATLRGPDHVYEMANPAYRRLVGHRTLIGLPVREALPELEGQGFFGLLDEVYRSGEPFVGTERPLRIRPKDGQAVRPRFLNFVYQPLREHDEDITGIMIHGVDVTDLVEARHRVRAQAEALRAEAKAADEARREAEAAGRAKTDFLATMSHELRTPLNAVLGYTDLILSGVPVEVPEAARGMVRRIGISGRHLRGLIDEVLAFSRLDAGEERLAFETFDPGHLLREVHALIEPSALAKGLEIELDAAEGDGQELTSDRRKIRQILLALTGNAVKFTERGTVRLRVAVAEDGVSFEVGDTGPGIPEKHLDRIFAPFWQVDGSLSRKAGGTGLGLGISAGLAELLGAELQVESALGEGSVFRLIVPAA